MVFAEIREENVVELERCIDRNLLTMQGFTFEDLLQIQLIEGNNPVLSIADCSCLYLAEEISGTLLTGDGALRRIAEQQNIPVHGILWVLDELIARGLIAKTEAHEKLLQLKELNPRLPGHESQKRLKAWKPRS